MALGSGNGINNKWLDQRLYSIQQALPVGADMAGQSSTYKKTALIRRFLFSRLHLKQFEMVPAEGVEPSTY